MESTKDITIITADANRQLKDPKIAAALLETTFKGLSEENMKKAIMEGVIRGFDFKDFLEKNVYAVKYGNGYSLVTSIDHNRKIGAKSGVVGTDKPVYVMDGDKIVSCAVTVHKQFASGYIGDFTSEVFFDEYTTGQNLWKTKPRTMIAKVAEMHSLRKACPEELAQSYVEEEFQANKDITDRVFNLEPHRMRLAEVTNLEELKTTWASMPIQAKQDPDIIALKDELKTKLTPVEATSDVQPSEDAA